VTLQGFKKIHLTEQA